MGGLPHIVHLDADAFFVSCEQARDPSLVGKKCAVGGTERGIISSASYEARACGVYTPMPTVTAKRVCPDLILIPHTSGLYGTVSRSMFDLCETLTPAVQRNSIDEGYLDLEACRFADAASLERSVRGLQARIWEELRIPVSMGIASNKLVSQIASKLRKPRGFVVVLPGEEQEFMRPLSLGKLPGIGAKTEAELAKSGLRKVSDLFERSETELAAILGRDWRGMLALGRGEDDSEVETHSDDAKSYSKQETFFSDEGDFAEVERVAKRMIDELLPLVRADRAMVRTITVKVRYPDFTQESHGQSIESATDLEATFYPLVGPLLRTAWKKNRPLRLVSVKLSSVEAGATQLEMFAQADEKRRALAGVLDKLNQSKKSPVVMHGHQLPRSKKRN
ncbi:MAG TPA: DNA polymerase IV [Opitutaceae bacterium]|jgi:DNA polymerase-4|nr:DNA polymerase IV [Opitutaceae bacterium]